MSLANPLSGAPLIHGELLKLGIEIGQTFGRQIHGKAQETPFARMEDVSPQSRRWDRLDGSLRRSDAFISAALWLLADSQARPTPYVMARRDGASDGPSGSPGNLPRPAAGCRCRGTSSAIAILFYGEIFTRRLRAMGIRDRPTAPRSPWQNGHTERLIGSIMSSSLASDTCVTSSFLIWPITTARERTFP